MRCGICDTGGRRCLAMLRNPSDVELVALSPCLCIDATMRIIS
jgi:thymidylate synthase